MPDPQTIQKIAHELNQAEKARGGGNAGRSRVCARRAAGWAIEAYLQDQGEPLPTSNAFKLIQHFADLPGHTDQVYTVLHHLTVKLEKDDDYSDAYYPVDGVDLVAEARWLAEKLLQTTF